MTYFSSKFYCDESGNTGFNLLDSNQPLFLLGGWLVSDGANEFAVQLVREYLHSLYPHNEELHGTELLKSEDGMRNILYLTRDMYKLYCAPICQIIEKRFILAGRVIIFFMNSCSNPNIPVSFEDIWEGKREITEKIYMLPDEVFEEFVLAYDTLDRSTLLSSLRNIRTSLSLRLETNLADLMLGSLTNVDSIIEHHRLGREKHNLKILDSPNFGLFYMLFHSLEKIGREAEIPKITLVHDNSLGFEGVFNRIFYEYRDDTRNEEFREGPWSQIFLGLRSLKDIKFADSKEEPLLQAADVLLSTLNRFAVNIYRDKPSSDVLKEIASMILNQQSQFPAITRIITSNWFYSKLNSSL
jgi:hypothetical protein